MKPTKKDALVFLLFLIVWFIGMSILLHFSGGWGMEEARG